MMSYGQRSMVEVGAAIEMSLKIRPIFGTVTTRTLRTWVARVGMVLALVASSLSGCTGKPPANEVGPTDASGDAPADAFKEAVPCLEPSPTFTEIQKLFDQNCVSCHVAGSGLDLTAGQSYANLVGQPAPASESCGGVLVVPGSPETSYLYVKLSSPHPCSGLQMPRTDIYSIPLPQCLQQLVRDWITAGALPEGNVSDASSSADSVSDSDTAASRILADLPSSLDGIRQLETKALKNLRARRELSDPRRQ